MLDPNKTKWPVQNSCFKMLVKLTLINVFSSLNNVFTLLCIVFLTHIYVLFVAVLTLWVAPPEMFCNWYRF